MKVLVARKEYVYNYLEYMYSNVQYIETGDRTDEFKPVAHALDLDILAVGDFEPASLSTKVFTIEEFAALYFELRDRKQVLDDEQEHLEEYCNILEEFLAKK
ncbi:hypothetical protein P4679_24175 [Priestia megaterium]|uniref:hypothetical protein n=1 Tax=Priestia megaterium TaxID=1404 RepID=UPI002E1F8D01|nr:hypothetical protein [Priestia megaterium]